MDNERHIILENGVLTLRNNELMRYQRHCVYLHRNTRTLRLLRRIHRRKGYERSERLHRSTGRLPAQRGQFEYGLSDLQRSEQQLGQEQKGEGARRSGHYRSGVSKNGGRKGLNYGGLYEQRKRFSY